MTTDEVLDVFRQCGAILDGHFILASGLHSPMYLQKAFVFMWPDKTEILCRALAARIRDHESRQGSVDVAGLSKVVSPAVGGIIPGYETARHLGLPAIYTERVEGKFQLRRGFGVEPGEKVVVVEDVISTGGSVKECVDYLQELGADVVAVACLVDRSGGRADVGIPLIALAEYEVPAYSADALPPELASLPAVEPGSRHAR